MQLANATGGENVDIAKRGHRNQSRCCYLPRSQFLTPATALLPVVCRVPALLDSCSTASWLCGGEFRGSDSPIAPPRSKPGRFLLPGPGFRAAAAARSGCFGSPFGFLRSCGGFSFIELLHACHELSCARCVNNNASRRFQLSVPNGTMTRAVALLFLLWEHNEGNPIAQCDQRDPVHGGRARASSS